MRHRCFASETDGQSQSKIGRESNGLRGEGSDTCSSLFGPTWPTFTGIFTVVQTEERENLLANNVCVCVCVFFAGQK